MTRPEAPPQLVAMGVEAAPVLARLHAIAFCGGEVWDVKSFATMLAVPGTTALVAMFDGAPAGFVLSRTVCGETEILTLAVHPEFRRRGVGTRLVREICRGGQVFLEVSVENTGAETLYHKCGFVAAGIRKDYYRDGSDALVLVSSAGQR